MARHVRLRLGLAPSTEVGTDLLGGSCYMYFLPPSSVLRHCQLRCECELTPSHQPPPARSFRVVCRVSFAVSVCLFVRLFCCAHLMRLLLFTGVFHFGSAYLVHVLSHQSHQ